MLLGFKTKLNLNNLQRTQMAKHADVARHAWNWGLGIADKLRQTIFSQLLKN